MKWKQYNKKAFNWNTIISCYEAISNRTNKYIAYVFALRISVLRVVHGIRIIREIKSIGIKYKLEVRKFVVNVLHLMQYGFVNGIYVQHETKHTQSTGRYSEV